MLLINYNFLEFLCNFPHGRPFVPLCKLSFQLSVRPSVQTIFSAFCSSLCADCLFNLLFVPLCGLYFNFLFIPLCRLFFILLFVPLSSLSSSLYFEFKYNFTEFSFISIISNIMFCVEIIS